MFPIIHILVMISIAFVKLSFTFFNTTDQIEGAEAILNNITATYTGKIVFQPQCDKTYSSAISFIQLQYLIMLQQSGTKKKE